MILKAFIELSVKNDSDFFGGNFEIIYRIGCIKWEVNPIDSQGRILKSHTELGVKNESDLSGRKFEITSGIGCIKWEVTPNDS